VDVLTDTVSGVTRAWPKVAMVILLALDAPLAQQAPGGGKPATSSDSAAMLNQVYEAQKSATSYRMKMVQQYPATSNTLIQEISCPNRKRLTLVEKGRIKSDVVQIEGIQYTKSPGGGWRKVVPPVTVTAIKTVSGCPGGPADYLGGSFNLSELLGDIKAGTRRGTAEITKGGSSSVKGVTCEIWDVATRNLLNEPESVELCIRARDSLPSRIVIEEPAGKTEVTYWDWNDPSVSINPPLK